MACMEHDCAECGHVWFDNVPRRRCELCGSWNVAHFFDEDYHQYQEEEYDETDLEER